jgi:hypothetical protein
MDSGTGIFLGIVAGSLIVGLVWVVASRRNIPKVEAESGKKPEHLVTITEVEGLIEKIGAGLSEGIRSALGFGVSYDARQEEEATDLPPAIHELEMDPFMKEFSDGWIMTGNGSSEQNDSTGTTLE